MALVRVLRQGAVSGGLLFTDLHLPSAVPSLFHIPIVPTLWEVASSPRS